MDPVEISQLRNLGRRSAEMFSSVGVHSPNQIRQLGSVGCYLLVKSAFPNLSLNFMWAVEGFLLDLDWREIPEDRKRALLNQVQSG